MNKLVASKNHIRLLIDHNIYKIGLTNDEIVDRASALYNYYDRFIPVFLEKIQLSRIDRDPHLKEKIKEQVQLIRDGAVKNTDPLMLALYVIDLIYGGEARYVTTKLEQIKYTSEGEK